MTGPDSDNELEAFLTRRSLLHRRFSEGDQSEPSADLDRIVLAKAREAIKRPSDTPVYRSPQWAMPVGLAASVLLVFAVALKFVHVSNQQPQLAAERTAAPQVSVISDARELPAETPAAPAPALADAKTEAGYAPAPAAVARNEAESMKRATLTANARQAKAAAPAVARSNSAGSLESRSVGPSSAQPSALTADARIGREVDSQAALVKRDDADARQGLIAGSNVVSGVEAGHTSDAPPLTASTRTGVIPKSVAAMAAGASASLASAEEAKPAPVDETARSEPSKDESKQTYTASTNAGAGSTLEEATVIGGRRVRGGKRPAVPNAPAAIALEKAKHPNPDEWLREIGELRTAGRVDEANRELDMFRRAYPDHSIPSSAAEPQPPAQ